MRRPLTVALAGAVLVVGGGLAVGGAAAGGRGTDAPAAVATTAARTTVVAPPASAPLVLVSGRDDHGELASEHVALHASPTDARPTGQVEDGTLARVVAVEGTWLRVRTVEGRTAEGWVDDFYLRRELHLVGPAPTCRASVSGHPQPAGAQAEVLALDHGRARVRLLGSTATGWVARTAVHELAPREGCGAHDDDAPASGHHHHH